MSLRTIVRLLRPAAAFVLCLAALSPTQARSETFVTLRTPRGVNQSFLLIKPDNPTAAVILFAGGHGALGLAGPGRMNWGSRNFLVRVRETFASHGLMVAVVDAPSDRQSGMNAIFRMGGAHAGDIGAVAARLRTEANVPVWLIGTSMGTFSAAGGAIAARGVDGLVLTSTITRSKPNWKIAGSHPNGVASMDLPRVTVPSLIVSHRRDGCDITPAADAPKLKARLTASKPVEIMLLDGGSPPQSAPCEAMAQHGFLGIEGEAVATIARFIKANAR
jgi:pimeloyl-ACP methyl ester carboxylesterase